VVAPADAPLEQICAKVRKRALWIMSQIRFFAQFQPRTPERQYLPGETHRYLGRQYRLKVEASAQAGVKLTRGFITVMTPSPKEPAVTRRLVDAWFLEHARQKFQERLEHCLRLFPNPEAVRPVGLMIRELSGRWGSMTQAGRLVLNSRLIQAPVPCIDYVIVHELCHRIHAHHGPAFWRLLVQLLPDWERRKLRLEQAMM
jgi:predicted metal-dependent hydrolase